MADLVADFDKALKDAFSSLNVKDIELKPEQRAALSAVALQKKDCLCILPTGFGKSLIFQLVPFVADSLHQISNSCVVVVSPLNAIIFDQIEKLKAQGIGVRVFKQGIEEANLSIDENVKFLYGHAEVFVESSSLRTLFRSSFKDRVKAVVIDEAHFIIQW